MHDILINWSPQETRVAVIENGAVQELHIERTLERGLVGNIYLGKVARVLPGMQSAFIDVGLERAAFLHVADLHGGPHAMPRGDVAVQVPIERQVFEGQTLMVQVIKDPIGTKGARLSTQISIAGRLLVFLPQDNHIGISQKIGSPEARDQLRSRMQRLAAQPDDTPTGGFILRTNAEEATDDELADDIAYLRKAWNAIRAQGLAAPVQFDAPDGKPVNLLFVLLVPEQATEQHLQILSELAQMFSDRGLREQLAAAPDAAAIHTLYANWDPHAAGERRAAV